MAERRWPEYRGERWSVSGAARDRYGLNWVKGVQAAGLSTTEGTIHLGGNSGFGAVGLAVQFGATRIVLLGYDMQRTGGRSHWHGDHPSGMGNGNNFKGWCKRFAVMASDLAAIGVAVVNASRATALTCFERRPLEAALYGEVSNGQLEAISGERLAVVD